MYMNENNQFPEGFNPVEEAKRLINKPSSKSTETSQPKIDQTNKLISQSVLNKPLETQKLTPKNAGVLNRVLKETYSKPKIKEEKGTIFDRYA